MKDLINGKREILFNIMRRMAQQENNKELSQNGDASVGIDE